MESASSDRALQNLARFQGVSVVRNSETMESALRALRDGSEVVVVLDSDDRPCGFVDRHHGLQFLLAGEDRTRVLAEVPLRSPSVVSAQLDVEGFLFTCDVRDRTRVWVLVDGTGRYVGVLDAIAATSWQQTAAPSNDGGGLAPLGEFIEALPWRMALHDCNGQELASSRLWRDRSDAIPLKHVTRIPLSGIFAGLEVTIVQEDDDRAGDRLNRLKDEFIARISHEFKTPLTSVIGMSSLLSAQNLGQLSERQSRYLNMIYRSGRHLLAIVDNIVDLAKAESGHLDLNLTPVDARQICTWSIQQFRQTIAEDRQGFSPDDTSPLPEDLAIELDVDPQVGTTIADSRRLQQMLLHLLSNAFKFTEGGSYPAVGITVRRWEGWIAFTVWDRGVGIPEDKQHLIFEKFQQLESPLVRRAAGTGLGLVLTRALARLHGGEVTFVSQAGMGSQFTLLLPPVPPQAMAEPPLGALPRSQRLVLVADTHSREIDRLVTLLEARGYWAAIARSGVEALEKTRQLRPAILFLAADLPVLSSRDLLCVLAQEETPSPLRIVVLRQAGDRNWDGWGRADATLTVPIAEEDLDRVLPPASTLEPQHPPLLCLGTNFPSPTLAALETLNYRLLQVDDVFQGNILAAIWHPLALVVTCDRDELRDVLTSVRHAANLRTLPILVDGVLPAAIAKEFVDLNASALPQGKRKVDIRRLEQAIAAAVGAPPSLLLVDRSTNSPLSVSLRRYLTQAGIDARTVALPHLVPQYLTMAKTDALVVVLHDDLDVQLFEQAIARVRQANKEQIITLALDGRSPRESLAATVVPPFVDRVLHQPQAIGEFLAALRQQARSG